MARRPMLFATVAVVLAGAAGATAVFLAGSKQRRDDRAAYLAYERAVLFPVAESKRIVERGIVPALRALRESKLPGHVARGTSDWSRAFAVARASVMNLTPPSFLGDIERRWTDALEADQRLVDAFARAVSATGTEREALVAAAETALTRAAAVFERAAERMQFHRRRLGLGPTPELPDPVRAVTL